LSKKTFEAAAAANAHLIVQLKDNQLTLRQKVEAACNTTMPLSGVRTVDEKRRNRHETRTIAVFDATPAVVGTQWEPYVAAVVQVERIVHAFQPATGLWKTSAETSFYLCNCMIDANRAAIAVRMHWGIENAGSGLTDGDSDAPSSGGKITRSMNFARGSAFRS
jgi:hypothetical protein